VAELAKEFKVTTWSIRHWVKQAARDAGTGDGGLTSVERHEVRQLRAQVRQLKQERDILSKAAAWFATESSVISKRSSGS
jgi:transposase